MSTKNPYVQFIHNDYFTHHFYHKKKVEEPVINEIVDVYGPALKPAGVVLGKIGFVVFFNWIQKFFFGIFALFSIFIFPFYYRVFKKNRGNDKNLPIFPILSHFYRIVCFQLFCWFNGFVVTQILMFFQIPCESFAQILVLLPGYAAPVFNILITILAIQRFLIYFFPESENYANFKKRAWNFIIILLYALIFAWNFGFSFAKYNLNQENFEVLEIFMPDNTSESIDAYDTINMKFYISLESISILSTFLYIPIFISVTNKTHISVIKSKPERYICYQALFLCLSKITTIILLIYIAFVGYEQIGELRLGFMLICNTYFATIPFSIQLTYLFCNRRNVNSIYSTVIPKTLFFKIFRKPIAVGPMEMETTLNGNQS